MHRYIDSAAVISHALSPVPGRPALDSHVVSLPATSAVLPWGPRPIARPLNDTAEPPPFSFPSLPLPPPPCTPPSPPLLPPRCTHLLEHDGADDYIADSRVLQEVNLQRGTQRYKSGTLAAQFAVQEGDRVLTEGS